jgi:hypothetical protein
MELKTNARYTACLIIQAYITYIHSIAIRGGGMSRTEYIFTDNGTTKNIVYQQALRH